MKEKILIVEDEAPIREMLGYTLMKNGYRIIEAADAEEARELLEREQPGLILMDWMLPGMSGVDFTRKLAADPQTRDIPVIMITARSEEEDMISALDTGADDYLTKPFSTRELMARIRAVLRRRSDESPEAALEYAGLTLDPVTHRVSAGQLEIVISPTEFRLLHFFIRNPERVFSRSQLLDSVWGQNVYIEERTVDVHIRRLRNTLAPFGIDRYIQTVRSVGYRFSGR